MGMAASETPVCTNPKVPWALTTELHTKLQTKLHKINIT